MQHTIQCLCSAAVALALLVGGQLALAADAATSGASAALSGSEPDWQLFRGGAQATGVSRGDLSGELSVLWKFPVEQGAFEATAAIADGVVFIGDLDGAFRALDLMTGKELWTFKIEAGFNASAAVRGGAVYVGDMDGTFHCLDAKTGAKRWQVESEGEIDSSANFYKDNVLFGSQDANLYCVNAATGKLVWKHAIADQIRCMPTVIEDRAFLAGCDAKLHVIDLTTGEEVKSVEIDGPTGSTPAAAADFVYFGTEGGTFFCINWREGAVTWKYRSEKRSQPFRSSAAVTPQAVVVGGRDKLVHAFDPKTGKELWTFTTKGPVDSSPVVAGRRVFVGSGDGRLYALDLQSGKKQWEYDAGGDFVASPAVAGGRLVIASADGVVYCFGK